MDLKELRLQLKAGGVDTIKKPLYPRPCLTEWLEITHPDIIKEFRKWFDTEVRK